MTKPGLSLSRARGVLRRAISNNGWALCIGAGTSLPVFPTWDELVSKLVSRDIDADPALAARLLKKFSPDSLIEAARARLAMNEDDFSVALSEELYSKLRSIASDEVWKVLVRAFETERLGDLSDTDWGRFNDFSSSHFSSTSAWEIAVVVANALNTERAPTAILSFNAESLMLALINSHLAKTTTERTQQLDKIVRSISSRGAGRLPYIFCHGLLRIPNSTSSHVDSESHDKLVFLEGQYLDLGNTIVSWQSIVFVETCMARTMVFVGVSLSDPNMRSWLFRVAQNRKRELHETKRYDGDSSSHYWINKHPGSDVEASWIEASVSHLGVQLVWIGDWPDAGKTLSSMLGQT